MINRLKKEDIQLSDWEFEFQQRGEHPLLLADWWLRALHTHTAEAFGLHTQNYDYLMTSFSRGYVKKAQKQEVLERMRKAILDQTYLDRLFERSVGAMEDFALEVKPVREAIDSQLDSLSNNQVAELFALVDTAFLKIIPWFWAPYYPIGENILTDIVRKHLSMYEAEVTTIADLDEAVLLVSYPIRELGLQKEQRAFAKLVEFAFAHADWRTNQAFIDMMHSYLSSYSWLTTFLMAPLEPLTLDVFSTRVEQALKDSFLDTYTQTQKNVQENKEKAQKILALVAEDSETLQAIANARELGYVLTAGVELALEATAELLPLMKSIANRLKIEYTDIQHLFVYEILAGLRTGTMPTQEEFAERKKGFVLVIEGTTYAGMFGPAAASFAENFDTHVRSIDITVTELKGQVANKGHATGKVRVANTPQESNTLLEGEILVCPMTNPDYVPAMRRAAAIVTDEGGLLSHAAIMSREFNKPCVIATKTATKVLKDGDMVEVDANTGIVRKI